MRVLLPRPIDGRVAITLRCELPASDREGWRAEIASMSGSFDRFVAAGGLIPVIEPDRRQELAGRLDWDRGQFAIVWPQFPFGEVGLTILLRMLGHLRRGEDRLASVALHGTSIAPDHPAAIAGLEEVANKLPSRVASLPFRLELRPIGDWINIECESPPPIPPAIPPALHEAIWSWGKVANAGGFQVVSEAEGAPRDDAFGVGISGPTVADDFLEWHCLMMNVPVGGLKCLVNILASCSRRIFPLSAVYIG
jgi:hypothetical protein